MVGTSWRFDVVQKIYLLVLFLFPCKSFSFVFTYILCVLWINISVNVVRRGVILILETVKVSRSKHIPHMLRRSIKNLSQSCDPALGWGI